MPIRHTVLDLIRTLAIVLMVIFHFCYDLKYFGWVTWNTPDGAGWQQFRYVILTLFFICVGAGLTFAHGEQFKGKKFLTRQIKIVLGAILITLMSLVMFRHNWIFFGVLHFIFVASLCGVLLVRWPKLALTLGLSIIGLTLLNILTEQWPFNFISVYLPRYSTDYVPIFPWLGVIFIGIFLAQCQWFNNLSGADTPLTKKLALPGKHSLLIYLLHQPLLFAILAPIHWWLN